MTNKEKAVALVTSVGIGNESATQYINPTTYIQHNPASPDGLEGFLGFLRHKPEGGYKTRVIRAFEDGDYAFTHSEGDFGGGPTTFFDIFRFEDGLIVEHWDNMQPTAGPNPSGHTMTDGETEVTDEDKTEENKEIVKNFLTDILINHKMENLASYYDGDRLTQHNPQVADGLSGLGAALKMMQEHGIVMKYDAIHLVLGQGNFVLAASEGIMGPNKSTFYDLFRLENGKIVEHWDVIEPVAPADQWKNPNGKF